MVEDNKYFHLWYFCEFYSVFLMRKFQLLILSLILPFTGFMQDINKFDLGGNWKFRKQGMNDWTDAQVPGCVHLDLMRNGLIDDPFYRDNELKDQWIGETGWEYKREFSITENELSWRHVELVCKGLDTYANVYLNDSLVIVADNMFRDWYSNVRKYLRIGTNVIRIEFPSIVNENRSRYERMHLRLPGDEKVVCRKAAYHFGWDWGPALITCGIWRPIYIRFWEHANVLGVRYIQKSLTDTLALITAELIINSSRKNSVRVDVYVDSLQVIGETIEIGKTSVTVFRKDFTIKNPRKWWPNGMGLPELYRINHMITLDGKIVGKGQQRIGLRNIILVQEKDSIGKSFYFKVNEIPVFIKGANYVPQDNFPVRLSDSTYRALITDVKDANMNMLRVWGGGIYENDIFYDLCDEQGIMVWQDFMFACAMYPGDKGFLNNARVEAIQNIVRLRRHPCLALWCGNNEIDEGWKNWGWQKQYKYSPVDSAEVFDFYKDLFHNILPENVAKFDSARPYIPTSPLFGWGRKESMQQGDSHYWGVWWGKEPLGIYKTKVGRFMSEYGFQGFPDLSSIDRFTLPEDRYMVSPIMKTHQKHSTGYETIDEYLIRDYNTPKNFESYAFVSQLLQAEGLKIAIEAHRRAKPVCMGTLFWQLNDCWPAVSWSARDYFGKKKALFYSIRKLYQKFLVSPVIEKDRVRVYVVSDSMKAVNATLRLELIDFTGTTLSENNIHISVPSGSSQVYFDTSLTAMVSGHDPGSIVLFASLIVNKKKVSEGQLYFCRTKELNLSKPVFSARTFKMKDVTRIEITSNTLAKNVFLSIPGSNGDFSDNYFDLLPGEKKIVTFISPLLIKGIRSQIQIKSLFDTY